MWQKSHLFNIKLDIVNRYQALDIVAEFFDKKHPSLICTVNAEFIMRAKYNEEFKKILNDKSSLNLIDGYGVVWALKMSNSWLPQWPVFKQIYAIVQWLLAIIFYPVLILFYRRSVSTVAGSDFLWDIAKWSASNRKSIFLLGNKNGLDPNAVEKASLELQTRIYDLKISGTFSTVPSADIDKASCELIKNADSDIIFCGFGSPHQEYWLAKNLQRSGAKVGIGLGGSFDFVCGAQRRAPHFFRILGMEWLWRIFTNPRRLKRFPTLFKFLCSVLAERIKS